MKNIVIVFGLLFSSFACFAQDGYPVPPRDPGQLFYLQHTRNKNTVVYELNLKNGKFNEEKPVNIFWIRYSEKGQRQNLSFIQRAFAYGINSVQLKDGSYELSLVSYKKHKIFLKRAEDGNFRAYTTINNREAILSRVFIKISGGALFTPKVDYIELTGIDAVSKNAVSERLRV